MKFDSLEEMISASAAGVRPPERLLVSEAAPKIRYLNNPGSYVGYWDNDFAPYLVEPMNVLTSTDYTGMIFAGPARTGKSDMFFNWLAHTAVYDPADMMMVHMTMNVARDWSQKDLRRFFRHTKKAGVTVAPGRHNMSTHDVRFLSGMHLLVKWPTITELSGKTVGRNWIADYDRITEDVDGEGNAFDLTAKRGATFRRNAMTVAESSPGYPIILPEGVTKWVPSSRHEAPPTMGILSLYNRGDRRRWYWKCPHCREKFEPAFKLLVIPDSRDHVEAAEATVMGCPHCGGIIHHDTTNGVPGKHELNIGGRWIMDGQRWERDDSVSGKPMRSDTASFWMKGPAASFTTWRDLALKMLKAEEEFERTGSQSALKVTVNTDQGEPYSPRGMGDSRLPEDLKDLSRNIGHQVVPHGVRFLVATVDVQANRFEVQVQGLGHGGDITLIDRFAIRKSNRVDADGDPLPVRPDTYSEDWHLLIDQVMLKTYPLADGSGRVMQIKMTACDSGGSAKKRGEGGVTANAYALYRHIRDDQGEEYPRDLIQRFQLIKGSSSAEAPRVQIRMPDAERKDRYAKARGEIPVMFINGNQLKDELDNMLDRRGVGSGMIVFPDWLEDWFWLELVAEVKTEKGWLNPRKLRNEAWDLLVYTKAICLHHRINIEHLDWDDPPGWADDWDANSLVFNPNKPEEGFQKVSEVQFDFSQLGSALA